jgi:TPR repeat protein
MSISYCVWKWKGRRHISRGLCYLFLMEYGRHPDVVQLDASLSEELEAAFAEEHLPEDFPLFSYFESECHLALDCFSSTPDAVPLWLERYADRHGLVFFDPQTESISEADQKAFEAYRAAQREEVAAEKAAEDRQRWPDEFRELSTKAAAGDVIALVELGNRHGFGEGTAKDLVEAFKCYRDAAERGNADGMFNLASCYRRGEGTPIDAKMALHWYERAMVAGDLFAPYELGRMLADGEGVPRDMKAAEEHFKMALQRGHPDARKTLNDLAKARGQGA